MTNEQRAQKLHEIRECALGPFRRSAEIRAQYCNNEEWFLLSEAALLSGRVKIYGGGDKRSAYDPDHPVNRARA